jgi:hypothetical protein
MLYEASELNSLSRQEHKNWNIRNIILPLILYGYDAYL